ncbi:MAG: patatin-like phospholipase family protein [Pseudomonadota bacterium]
MAKSKTSTKKRPISIGLQGGGAHGAFTWGVLDRLLEDGRLDIKAVTATSAGAMNAVAFASGLAEGGVDGARETLERFWQEISRQGAPLAAITPPPMPMGLDAFNPFSNFTPFSFVTALQSFASPYDLNPFDFNPLRDAIDRVVDFEAVRAAPVELHIAATNVETGRVKVFSGDEVTLDATLASACLPQTFKAVEIDGEPYWDGGYLGNPSIFPLIYSDAPKDVLLVLLNPLERAGPPKSAGAIQDRLNEISFNAALLGELRAIAFVQKLLDENWLTDRVRGQYRRLHMHAINGGAALCELSLETKYDTRWGFLTDLRDRGRDYASTWLTDCATKIGKQSTVDLKGEFLSV